MLLLKQGIQINFDTSEHHHDVGPLLHGVGDLQCESRQFAQADFARRDFVDGDEHPRVVRML